MTETAQLQLVPFSKLIAGDAINARVSGGKEGIDVLAASIKAKGLIQPLIVRPAGDGKFEVMAGRRRYRAIAELVKGKVHPRSWPVPVSVRDENDLEALDTSLAENDCRLPMHAVDRFETFAKLTEQGLPAAEIASRYSLQERQVRQALALGNLAPEIRDAWRKGKIEAEVAQAFTMHPDQAVQVSAFEKLKKARNLSSHGVRRELAGDRPRKVDVSPEILDRYTAAGGAIDEDLFEGEAFLEDGALVRKIREDLRSEKEAEARALLAGQGWAWVARSDELPKDYRYAWQRLRPEVTMSAEDEARVEELRNRDTDDEDEADRLDQEADAIEEAAKLAAYTKEMRARCGVVIDFHHDVLELVYGLVKPSDDGTIDLEDAIDQTEEDEADEDVEGDGSDDEEASDETRISYALGQSLGEALTVSAAKALATMPSLAMGVITAALIARSVSPANVRNEGHRLVRDDPDRRPDFVTAFNRLSSASLPELEACFAEAVASTLDLTLDAWRYKGRDTGIGDLIAALPAEAFTAAALEAFNAADYFKRAPKAVALEAIAEIREAGAAANLAPEDVLADMKKAELAAVAAEQAIAAGWLPPELRGPVFSLKEEV